MPVLQYFTVTGAALFSLLFISDALFGDSERDSRFNGSFYESATYAPRQAEPATPERYFTRDATPADRVRESFAQFVPNEGKRGKRIVTI